MRGSSLVYPSCCGRYIHVIDDAACAICGILGTIITTQTYKNDKNGLSWCAVRLYERKTKFTICKRPKAGDGPYRPYAHVTGIETVSLFKPSIPSSFRLYTGLKSKPASSEGLHPARKYMIFSEDCACM